MGNPSLPEMAKQSFVTSFLRVKKSQKTDYPCAGGMNAVGQVKLGKKIPLIGGIFLV